MKNTVFSPFHPQFADKLQIFDCRSAAVIPNPIESHDVDSLFLCEPYYPCKLSFKKIRCMELIPLISHIIHIPFKTFVPVGITEGQPKSHHPASVRALPPEQIGRQAFLLCVRPHENIIIHSTLFQDLWQHTAVTEGIHIVACPCDPSEFFIKISLAIQAVAYEGFTGRQVAVGLYPPSSCDHPPPLPYAFLDLPEHFRRIFLHPFVIRSTGRGKDEFGKFLHTIQRGPEGRFDFGKPLLPPPQPHRIKVRITYQVKFSVSRQFSHISSLSAGQTRLPDILPPKFAKA